MYHELQRQGAFNNLTTPMKGVCIFVTYVAISEQAIADR